MSYYQGLRKAMQELSRHPGAIFMGQGVGVTGTSMSPTLDLVEGGERLEMPVAEEMQVGMALGMALEGLLPICIIPRWNFMLRCADAIVNHLDRLPIYSEGGYAPRVIIRTAAPSTTPFYPGPQHDDDLSDAFRVMLRTIKVVKLLHPWDIVPEYIKAMMAPHSTILVEYTGLYGDERAKVTS